MNVINKILDRYKFVLHHVWNICSKPDATLRYESLLNTFYGKKILQQFILPLAEILLVVAFLSTLLYFDLNLASAIVKSIFTYLIFIVSFGGSMFLVRLLLQYRFKIEIDMRNIMLMVASLMAVVFVVKFFGYVFPGLFFVSLFYLYNFYLVWVMSEGVIDIPEEKRNECMVLVSFIVVATPFVVEKLLNSLIPNL